MGGDDWDIVTAPADSTIVRAWAIAGVGGLLVTVCALIARYVNTRVVASVGSHDRRRALRARTVQHLRPAFRSVREALLAAVRADHAGSGSTRSRVRPRRSCFRTPLQASVCKTSRCSMPSTWSATGGTSNRSYSRPSAPDSMGDPTHRRRSASLDTNRIRCSTCSACAPSSLNRLSETAPAGTPSTPGHVTLELVGQSDDTNVYENVGVRADGCAPRRARRRRGCRVRLEQQVGPRRDPGRYALHSLTEAV